MSADTLTVTSRAFYERSKAKIALSILSAGFALMLLGFTSQSGGQASSASYQEKALPSTSNDDNVKMSLESLTGGYGFAAFCYILAFILFLVGAIYVSPLFCGSNNERKMIRAPQEIDAGYSAYNDNPSASAPQV